MVAKDIISYDAENDEERNEESPTISRMSHDDEIVIKYRKKLVDVAPMHENESNEQLDNDQQDKSQDLERESL